MHYVRLAWQATVLDLTMHSMQHFRATISFFSFSSFNCLQTGTSTQYCLCNPQHMLCSMETEFTISHNAERKNGNHVCTAWQTPTCFALIYIYMDGVVITLTCALTCACSSSSVLYLPATFHKCCAD